MRILFTVHSYYPNQDGVQFVTKYLAEGLAEKGNSVTVITYFYPDKTKIKEEFLNGVSILRWDATTVHTIHKGDKAGYQKYILAHQDEYDVMVNVGTQTALTDWLFPISKEIHIPKLLYIHSIWDFNVNVHEYNNAKELIAKLWANCRWYIYYKKNTRRFKEYGMVTQLHEKDYSYRFFSNNYGIQSKIMGNAADDVFFNEEVDESINLPTNYIINVSNYNERKNQKLGIEAFLKSDIPDDWQLILIGSKSNEYSDQMRSFETEIRKTLNLSDKQKEIQILSDVPRKDINTYVKKAKLYLLTSTWEAFPISLVESMATSVPFISSNVGIVSFLSGGVVAHNIHEYVDWIEKFVNNPELRAKFGKRGKEEAVSRYMISDKVAQFENYLQEIITKNDTWRGDVKK